MAWRIVFHLGILSDYRKPFWRAARHAARRGQIDAVLGIAFVARHLIEFTREALRGEQNASYYSIKARGEADVRLQAAHAGTTSGTSQRRVECADALSMETNH
jgi:hopanoid C-2 methylase